MSLTGMPLVVLLSVLAVAAPIVLILFWRRGRHPVLGRLAGFLGVVFCQLCAISLIAVLANNSFGFYNNWSDVLGGGDQLQESVVANGLVPANGSEGTVIAISVSQTGRLVPGAPRRLPVLVWLPPQYDRPQFRHTQFPVTMMMPGQPGTPEGVFHQFDFAAAAVADIDRGIVKPFVAVLPPLMVDPPRDTECTNVPNGPQAETWLAKNVRDAVIKRVRVTTGRWSAMGWSTGGFCAAKLLLRHRPLFDAAVGFGAYYDSETDHTTGKLFDDVQQRNENSPIWLIQHPAGQPTDLLIVVSKADRDSYHGIFYADSAAMIAQSAGTPGVATILLPTGGHNYHVYAPTMPRALGWLGSTVGL